MDLLDEVDDVASFQPQLHSDSEEESCFTIDVQAISNTLGESSLDVLARVRERLAKQKPEQDGPDDEEIVEDVSGKIDDISFGKSILGFGGEVQRLPQLAIDESEFETQVIPKRSEVTTQINDATDATQVLQTSQDAQRYDASTQLIGHNDVSTQLIDAQTPLESLFLEEEQPLTKEERQAKISKLAEQKKQARLERERQLEADITHTSLTDEENDLNDEKNDTVISSSNHTEVFSAKQLQEAEEFISIQKRNKDIRPQFERKIVFSKDKLLEAFNDSENDNLGLAESGSSPSTSPLKFDGPDEFDPRNDELDLVDLLKSPLKSATKTQRNPIEVYAESLKKTLALSPTREGIINLDSDSDLDIGSSPLKQKSSAEQHPLQIPELSKAEKFVLRLKFSKKKYGNSSGFLPPHFNENQTKSTSHKQFLEHLKRANISQLKQHHLQNPNHELLEEMEKDEEVMGSLLEREMERVRNIRKKEKLLERARTALLSQAPGDLNLDDNENITEDNEVVPESESGSGSDEEEYEGSGLASSEERQEESESEAESEDDVIKQKKRSNKLALFDDEDDEVEVTRVINEKRYDDSYMFGGKQDEGESLNRDDLITTHSVKETLEESIVDDSVSSSQNKTTEYELFQNLKPRENSSVPSQDSSVNYGHSINLGSLPEFNDSQSGSTQRITEADMTTQADLLNPTVQADTIDMSTQADTQALQLDEDTEIITPASVREGRESLHKTSLLKDIEEDILEVSENDEGQDHEEDHEEDPEVTKQRIKQYEDKIRKKELKIRKKRKEMERKGIKNMVEGEAQESEDEWQGLGGAEGEFSDQANSEDERMIDNNFNIDLRNEEVRNKFMEQYQIKDQQELEKLLDDIKNHRLTKKVAGNGFDIELSDEEDEILAAYRRQKVAEQQERMSKNKKLQALAKNEKLKAFFASIQEINSVIKFDDDDEDEEDENEVRKASTQKVDQEDGKEEEKEAPLKRIIRVEESFVQRQLSFLTSGGDDEYERLQKLSNFQHGVSDDEDDLQTLKLKSISNLTNSRSESPIHIDEKRSADDADLTDADDEFMPSFKKPSIIKSFKSFQELKGIQIKDGKQFSGVTISKQYRVASGSKASIAYMSRSKAQAKPSKSMKEKNIERSLSLSKDHGKKLFTSGGFES